MYYREPREPTAEEEHWVGTATYLAAIAICHARAQQALATSELRSRQLATLYAVSSSVNAAITRLKSTAELYDYACRIAVEQGLARLAWIGLLDAERDRVCPVARFGADDGYVDRIVLSSRDARNDGGPASRVLESGRAELSADIESDPGFAWKQEALSRGLRCCAAFPITLQGRTTGVFALYAARPLAFEEEELEVLDNLARDISFAVESAQSEAERQRLVVQLGERVKELTLLHQVAHLLDSNAPFDVLLGDLVRLMPAAWQHPESCEAQVSWRGVQTSTPRFSVTPWMLSAPFGEPNEQGLLRVAYRELSPAPSGAPFLAEEVELLHSVGNMLSTNLSRRKFEAALRSSEQRLSTLIECTPNVSIQWFDLEGRIQYCNRASERLLGVSPALAKGKRLDELSFPVDEAARFGQVLQEVARTGQPQGPMEFQFRMPDGSVGDLSSTVFELPVAEGERCFVCVDVDMTARKRLEQQLHHSQRLQALGTLAGGIAHDFNNVLTAIVGNVEMGLADADPGDPVCESLEQIKMATARAVDLVTQILAFSRRDAPVRQELDARDVIREVARLLRATLPASVNIQLELAGDTPRILANGSQLHQVVMNLATNAALALTAHKGVLRISSERVILSKSQPGPPTLGPGCYARVRVSDTGCGMDHATLARMFEPFFTTRPKGQGTGLGLSVVHGIMQNHEGAVDVQSIIGEGTTFSLYFVEAKASEAPDLAPRSRPAAGNGKHILYVDDEAALVSVASRGLSRAGYRVTTHSDSLLALSDFRSRAGDFDAVVTDLSMPGLSGPELVRELRRLRPDVPIILLSGFVPSEDADAVRQLGVGEVMLKPHTVDDLALAIERQLDPRATRLASGFSQPA
jgi:PAS domain S-box-containing protein